MNIPTKLIDERKGRGIRGTRTRFWKGDNGIWYEAHELGDMVGIPAPAMRNRIDYHGYTYEFIMAKRTKPGMMLNGMTQGDKNWNKADVGNAEWKALGRSDLGSYGDDPR
jgi:hypothetical protein